MRCHDIYRDGPVYPIPARVISSLVSDVQERTYLSTL